MFQNNLYLHLQHKFLHQYKDYGFVICFCCGKPYFACEGLQAELKELLFTDE